MAGGVLLGRGEFAELAHFLAALGFIDEISAGLGGGGGGLGVLGPIRQHREAQRGDLLPRSLGEGAVAIDALLPRPVGVAGGIQQRADPGVVQGGRAERGDHRIELAEPQRRHVDPVFRQHFGDRGMAGLRQLRIRALDHLLDPRRGFPFDRLEIRAAVVRPGVPPVAQVPRFFDVVEAGQGTDDALGDVRVAGTVGEPDQAVGRFLAMDLLEGAQRVVALAGDGDGGEAGFDIANAGQRFDGGVRQPVGLAFLEAGWVAVPGGGGGEQCGRGLLGAQAGQPDGRLQAGARVRVVECLDEGLHRHAVELAEAVGHRAQGELADGRVFGQGRQLRGAVAAVELLEGEDGGDAGVEWLGGVRGDGEDGLAGRRLAAAGEDFPLGFVALDGAAGCEQGRQLCVRQLGDIAVAGGLLTGRGDLVDPADRLVRPAVAVAAVAPIREVEAGESINVQADGAGQAVEGFLAGDEGRLERLHRVVVDISGGPIAGEDHVAVVTREAGLVQVEPAGAGAAAIVGQRRQRLVGEVLVEPRVAEVAERGEMQEARVPALAVVGVVAHEHVEVGRNRRGEVVAGHQRIRLHLAAVRAHAHHAATEQGVAGAVRAFGVGHAEVAHADVKPAVDAHAHAVGGVVGAARVLDAPAEALDQGFFLVGHAVAGGVAEAAEVGRVDQVERAADEVAAARTFDVGHEVLELIGHAVAVGIGGADDLAIARHVAERAVFVGRDVDVAGGRDADGGGILHLRRLGEFPDDESFGNGVRGGGGQEQDGEQQGLGSHERRWQGWADGFSFEKIRASEA